MKLLNINISDKFDRTKQIGILLKKINPDIITFQEVLRHVDDSVFSEYKIESKIKTILANTYPYMFFGPLWMSDSHNEYGKVIKNYGGNVEQGNLIFSKHVIKKSENLFFHKDYMKINDWTKWEIDDHPRAIINSEISIKDKLLQIINVHGIWTKDKKGDKRTIKQCRFIVESALKKNIPTIITGDFNLFPETESIQIINKHFTNLIDKFKIKTTRPDFKDNIDVGNNVVDYIFVNSKIKVNDFKIINTDISDHFPLYLDFEISN